MQTHGFSPTRDIDAILKFCFGRGFSLFYSVQNKKYDAAEISYVLLFKFCYFCILKLKKVFKISKGDSCNTDI